MDYKTLLGLTSALVGGSVIGGQDPSFEYPAVQPKPASETILTGQAVAPAGRQQGFSIAMPDLERVVVAAGKAAPACDINIEITQDPQREKELKELGERMKREFGPDSDFMKKLQQEMGELKKREGQAGEHKMSEQNAKKWEQFHKEMEKRFGEGSEFQKKMKVWSEQHGQEMKMRFGPGSEFEKKMRVWSDQHDKEIQKKFGPGSQFEKKMRAFKLENGKMRELTPQERAEFEKEMSQLRIKLKDLPVLQKGDFHFKTIPLPKMPSVPAMPEGIYKFRTIPAVPGSPGMSALPAIPSAPLARLHSTDLSDVAKSLTPSQREKNKTQGFLYWSDLTKDQQDKLGAHGWSGNWSITYTKDGETFTVKSDRK